MWGFFYLQRIYFNKFTDQDSLTSFFRVGIPNELRSCYHLIIRLECSDAANGGVPLRLAFAKIH